MNIEIKKFSWKKKTSTGQELSSSAAAERLAAMTKARRPRAKRSWLRLVSYILFVIVPTLIASWYYLVMASPQYRVETQFAVRGSNSSPLSELGISVLPGFSNQSSDSYVVVNYIQSRQLLTDIKKYHNVDLRQYYSKPGIDFLYRIDPSMSLEKFEEYWTSVCKVEFNSTTGNSELVVYAFTPDDARKISEMILDVSERLVNNLSDQLRERLIQLAQKEVNRTQDRLSDVRSKLTSLRNREQALDPSQIVTVETGVISELEKQLAELKTRRRVLTADVNESSPTARMLDRQITAVTNQLKEQRARVGTGKSLPTGSSSAASGNRLSGLVSKYNGLMVDEEFATKAYTTALGALETAIAEAQKQERYFAAFVEPYTPASTLYPRRLQDIFLIFICLSLIWTIGYFLLRSLYEHAI